MNQPMMEGVKVPIMPDVHAGAGICIGYTATMNDFIVPNFIGVDIGCGLTALPLGKMDVSFPGLDFFIRCSIPFGMAVNPGVNQPEISRVLASFSPVPPHEFGKIVDNIARYTGGADRVWNSIGSLGGGNHFMSVNQDSGGNRFFVVHSGSRNFGKRIAEYHQKTAGESISREEMNRAIEKIKRTTPKEDIGRAIQEFRSKLPRKVKGLEYLEGKAAMNYFADMNAAQLYARLNRRVIIARVAEFLGIYHNEESLIESVHNYIDFEDNIIRKGAISAHKGERVIIPLSMADGILYCEGKGNPEWNCSAPHGAGRLMSRGKAKAVITVEDYKKRMDEAGVWTSCVGPETLDEAPQAYKDPSSITESVKETVAVLDRWREIYNFKAN
jgi:RNA-splicing ligase RtcB